MNTLPFLTPPASVEAMSIDGVLLAIHCGLGHYRMRGSLTVLSPEKWEQWQASEVALISPAASPAAPTRP